MIEKVISGELLNDGKGYKGSYEEGVYFHLKDETDGKTYLVFFAGSNVRDGIPLNKGKYLVLRGYLMRSNTKYDEFYVLEISIPFIEFFDEPMEN
jgi:hypothetical protein